MVQIIGKTWTLSFTEEELKGIVKEYNTKLLQKNDIPFMWSLYRSLLEIDDFSRTIDVE